MNNKFSPWYQVVERFVNASIYLVNMHNSFGHFRNQK